MFLRFVISLEDERNSYSELSFDGPPNLVARSGIYIQLGTLHGYIKPVKEKGHYTIVTKAKKRYQQLNDMLHNKLCAKPTNSINRCLYPDIHPTTAVWDVQDPLPNGLRVSFLTPKT